MHIHRTSALVLAVGLAACGTESPSYIECRDDTSCDRFADGRCIVNPATGNQFCAYPDEDCASGMQWSDLDVEESISGTCVADGGVDGGLTDGDPSPDASVPDATTDADTRTWSEPSILANVNTTGQEHYPAITDNGLELYFSRFNTGAPYGEIYVARRTSTSQPFNAPTAVTEVNGTNTNEISAFPSHDGLELFTSRAGLITRSTRSSPAALWSAPVDTGLTSTFATLSADDLTMYMVSTCPAEVNGGFGPCLWTSTRSARGAAWPARTHVPWPSALQWNSASVSTDGLRMLLGSPFSGSQVRAALSSRDSTSDAWGPVSVLDALALETTNQELRWNASETEIYLVADPAASGVGGFDIYVSVYE